MANDRVDFKVIILGDSNAGKTCLIQRYLYGRFRDDMGNTVGAAFGSKKVTVDALTFTMGIWDTAGSERYQAMTRMYYKNARAAIVCYDLTNQASFQKLQYWIKEMQQYEPECAVVLCGTKCDLLQDGTPRGVPVATVKQFAAEHNIPEAHMFETSSRVNRGVDEIFNAVAKIYASSNPNPNPNGDDDKVNLDGAKPQKKGGCC